MAKTKSMQQYQIDVQSAHAFRHNKSKSSLRKKMDAQNSMILEKRQFQKQYKIYGSYVRQEEKDIDNAIASLYKHVRVLNEK